MAAGYVQNSFNGRATFELFVRHLPEHRNYLVACGLEQALDFLENLSFSGEEISIYSPSHSSAMSALSSSST